MSSGLGNKINDQLSSDSAASLEIGELERKSPRKEVSFRIKRAVTRKKFICVTSIKLSCRGLLGDQVKSFLLNKR